MVFCGEGYVDLEEVGRTVWWHKSMKKKQIMQSAIRHNGG